MVDSVGVRTKDGEIFTGLHDITGRDLIPDYKPDPRPDVLSFRLIKSLQ